MGFRGQKTQPAALPELFYYSGVNKIERFIYYLLLDGY